jgi:hypothetical protein
MRGLALIGVPVLVGVVTVLLLARKTQGGLEATGAQMERDLRALGQQSEAELRQRAAQWARESESYYAQRIPQYVQEQVPPALTSVGLTPKVQDRMNRLGSNINSIASRFS